MANVPLRMIRLFKVSNITDLKAMHILQLQNISPVLTTCCSNPIHNKSIDTSMTNGNADEVA